MTLAQHYHAAQALSPKAARMAARLLAKSLNIPFDWRLSLGLALVERGRGADAFTTTDLAPLTLNRHDVDPLDERPRDHALRFVQAVQSDVADNVAPASAASSAGSFSAPVHQRGAG